MKGATLLLGRLVAGSTRPKEVSPRRALRRPPPLRGGLNDQGLLLLPHLVLQHTGLAYQGGRPNGSSTALYETRGKRRQKVFSELGMELAATACEQGNTTVLTINSDHTGEFSPGAPQWGRPPQNWIIHKPVKPTGGFPFSSAKHCTSSQKAKSLVTRIEFLAKLGRPSVSFRKT